jgi:hypothetical protein
LAITVRADPANAEKVKAKFGVNVGRSEVPTH